MTTHVSDVLNRLTQDNRPYIARKTHSERAGELPDAITALVDNKAYLPRHRRLQREYGDMILLKLAELARTKGKPSHWYAKVTSLAKWEQTLKMVTKLLRTQERAEAIMSRLGADREWLPWYIKQISHHSEAQIAGWVERAERARSRPKLFAWLCQNAP